jgi:hypothetical protein
MDAGANTLNMEGRLMASGTKVAEPDLGKVRIPSDVLDRFDLLLDVLRSRITALSANFDRPLGGDWGLKKLGSERKGHLTNVISKVFGFIRRR